MNRLKDERTLFGAGMSDTCLNLREAAAARFDLSQRLLLILSAFPRGVTTSIAVFIAFELFGSSLWPCRFLV
jgi:hypothetical protein